MTMAIALTGDDDRLCMTADEPGYHFVINARIGTDGLREGRVTTWRRVSGRSWRVTIYDLGTWEKGDSDAERPPDRGSEPAACAR